MNGVITFVCFWVVVCPLIVPLSSTPNTTNNGLPSVLSTVKKLLQFAKKNYQGMTLDTVFGLRVIEGQCKLLVEEHQKGQLEFASQSGIEEINEIGIAAGKLANMAVPHTLEQDREYFGLMKQLTVAPWKVFQPHRVVNPSLRWNFPLNPPDFSELDGDRCMSELMSGTKQNKNLCKLTEDCLFKMLSPGQLGYRLQRQVFYTIVAKKMGCDSQVNDYLVARTNYKNLDQVQHSFCTNAYYELEGAAATHGLIDEYRDLFLETEFICPSIGYFQFMRSDWLDAIISWQTPDGCFPRAPASRPRGNPTVGGSVPAAAGSPSHVNRIVVQQEHPNIPPPPNFHPPRAKPLPLQGAYRSNHTVELADEESPQRVTLASPDAAPRNPSPVINRLPPVQMLAYPQGPQQPQHSNFMVSMNEQQERQRQHYDVPYQVQSPNHGAHAHAQQVVPADVAYQKFPEAMQVQQPNYAWNNDVAYAPYDHHQQDPHNLPQVVPHHNRAQYEMGAQGQPLPYANAIRIGNGQQQQQQHLQQHQPNGVEVHDNPYLREYHLNRGLKSADPMPVIPAPQPQRPMRESQLIGGCLSHVTSMASAALAIYLRYLVDPGPPEFLHLRLENYLRHNAALKLTAPPPHVEVLSGGDHLHVKINPASNNGQVGVPEPHAPALRPPASEDPNVHAHHLSMAADSPRDGGNANSQRNQARLNDMMSQAWNFMGTYQRKYGNRFAPIHAGGSADAPVGAVPDYIHRAEVSKILPDWTVPFEESRSMSPANARPEDAGKGQVPKGGEAAKEDDTVSTAAAWVRHKDVKPRKGEAAARDALWQKVVKDEANGRQMEVHIIEIQSPLQRDLDHYLIAVTLISVICLFVLFRYFRQRRNVVRSKARHF